MQPLQRVCQLGLQTVAARPTAMEVVACVVQRIFQFHTACFQRSHLVSEPGSRILLLPAPTPASPTTASGSHQSTVSLLQRPQLR